MITKLTQECRKFALDFYHKPHYMDSWKSDWVVGNNESAQNIDEDVVELAVALEAFVAKQLLP